MKFALLLFSVFAFSTSLAAQTRVPEGTVIPVRMNASLDAKNCRPGQIISAKVAQDVPLYDGSKIKAGTVVMGEVISATPSEGTRPATISFRFDKIVIRGESVQLPLDLRALASPDEVSSTQEPTSQDYQLPMWDWTTNQIGNDVVYRGGGVVMRNANQVGTPVYGGVLSLVSSSPETGCRGVIAGNTNAQALWVFSSDACGVYGYDMKIAHAGRTAPIGNIVLVSDSGNLTVRKGSGLLLRVNDVRDIASESVEK